jgi:hypothetical protein
MSADTFGKGPPLLATPNFSDPATIEDYTGFDSDEDAERLQTMQPSDRAQSTGVAGGVSITYNRGEPYPLDLVSWIFTNISETGSWLIQQANTVAELDTGPRRDTSLGFGAALRFQGEGQSAAQAASPYSLTSYSISPRIRADLIHQERGILKFGPAVGDYVYLQLDQNGYIRFRKSNGAMNLVSLAPVTLGQFYRATGTYNSGTGTAQLIIDGVLQSSVGGSVGAVATSQLVTLAPADASRFAGTIDDVRLWNAAQSAASELTNMVGEMLPTTPGLVGYWKLNELLGTSAANSIAGGPALTLAGSPSPYWSYPERFWTSPNLHSWRKRHSLYYDPTTLTYQYLRVRVIDPQNPDGFLYFGRGYGSAAYQMTKGIRYGSSLLGWSDSSVRTRLPSGIGPVVRRAEPAPVRKISFWSTDKSEMYYAVDNVMRLRAGARDVLWVLEPYDEEWRHHSMIYGLPAAESEVAVANYGLWEHAQQIEGIV